MICNFFGHPSLGGALRLNNLIEGRLWHAFAPRGVAQFQPVATGVEEIQFLAREEPLGPVDQLVDGHLALVEQLARLNQGFGADGEGVMGGLIRMVRGNRMRSLTEQDAVLGHTEARYPRVPQPPQRLQAKKIAVELL